MPTRAPNWFPGIPRPPPPPRPPAGDRAAGAELERRDHAGERAAVRVEHHAGADPDDAHAELFGARGLMLPRGADLGEEAVAGGRRLVDDLVAPRPVPPDGRGRHERGGPRLGV